MEPRVVDARHCQRTRPRGDLGHCVGFGRETVQQLPQERQWFLIWVRHPIHIAPVSQPGAQDPVLAMLHRALFPEPVTGNFIRLRHTMTEVSLMFSSGKMKKQNI